MTKLAKETLEEWKESRKLVKVCSQGGTVHEGHIVDFDEGEIVLDTSYGRDNEKRLIVCRNYFSVKENARGVCHD